MTKEERSSAHFPSSCTLALQTLLLSLATGAASDAGALWCVLSTLFVHPQLGGYQTHSNSEAMARCTFHELPAGSLQSAADEFPWRYSHRDRSEVFADQACDVTVCLRPLTLVAAAEKTAVAWCMRLLRRTCF